MPLRCLGSWEPYCEYHIISTPSRLSRKTPRALRQRCADKDIARGFRMGEERLTRRVVFVELVGGEGYSGAQEKGRMRQLDDTLKGFAMKFEGQREAAQKAGRLF